MSTTEPHSPSIAPAAIRLDFEALADRVAKALTHLDHAVTRALDDIDFDARLRELVRLRASQLNGCAYCVDMHSIDARGVGESEQRLAALPVWRDTPFFDDRERAALALCEAMTRMGTEPVTDAVWDAVAAVFTEDESAALVSLVTVINAWNAVGATTRAWRPGSYRP